MTNRAPAESIRRRCKIALLLVIATLPIIGLGAHRSVEGMRITPEKWVSKSHPVRQQFDEFREQFEGNDVVLISWDGCTVDDSRLNQFEHNVIFPDETQRMEEHRRDYHRVITGYSAVRSLMAPPLNLSRSQAVERLRGTLVGEDGKTTCALVILTFDGNEERARSIDQLIDIAQLSTGLKQDQLYVCGPPHDGAAIDVESVRGVNLFGKLSTLLSAIICAWCLKSWRLSGVIIGIACYGQGLVLALVYYLGFTLDAILIIAPPLIFVLTVSAGVHLVNYYADQVELFGPEDAVFRAVQIGWKPCMLAALTTAIGLCSLMVSEVAPIVTFGGVSAATLLITTALLLCLLPGAMQRNASKNKLPKANLSPVRWENFGKRVCKHAIVIALLFTVTMLVSVKGLRNLSSSVDASSLFAADSKITQDYHWFESHIGTTMPVEVVVDFNSQNPMSFRQRAELVQAVHRKVQEVEGVGGVVSAMTFAPDIPETGAILRKRIAFKQMEAHQDEYIDRHFLYQDEQQQSWRISGRVSALSGVDYSDLKSRLQAHVAPLIAEQDSSSQIDIRYTGMMPLIQEIQENILQDLINSFLMAFLLIALALVFVLRNVKLTCTAMLPNLFPVCTIFGLMGWFNVPIDIGTMMTASVALGIAVDDTIHFLTCYRFKLSETQQPEQSVQYAVGKCGRAMLQTTLICALGMLVFSASPFVPTQRFGMIMACSLFAALIGDLVYLPAILTSPLGRWMTFRRNCQPDLQKLANE